MPYSTLDDAGNKIFEKVYNDSIARGKDKEYAARVGWTAVKNAGYRKDADSGKWVKQKSDGLEMFSMNIVKATWSKEDSVMRWRSVNSDTDPDLYDEAMSPELFKDFTDRIENKTPVPEPFKSIICEDDWCGGMPYLSIAHYRSGSNKTNVPGEPESVYVDGKMLKSTGICYDNPLGKSVFNALNRDLYKKKSDGTPEVPPENRIRVSIGFLDLEHKHILDDGTEKVFARDNVGQVCQLCSTGIGRKIYTKGQLVHLALTRVPVNPRTLVEVDKSMGDIITKKDDAKSIVGDLAEELEEKSLADDVLVVRADGSLDFPDEMMDKCYDPNTLSFDQDCIDELMMGNMPEMRNAMKANDKLKSDTVSNSTVTKSESWGDEPASSYLVVGDRQHPTTWHLPVKKSGKIDRGLMGAAHAALVSEGGHRGNSYEGPNKSHAIAKLRSLYKSQGLDWEAKSDILEESMADVNEVKGKKKVKPEDIETFDEDARVNDDKEVIGQKKAKTMRKNDEEEGEAEDKKETDADEMAEDKKEKKSMMAKFSAVADKVLELRGAGVGGKDAEAALQPLLNEVGSTIEKSLHPSNDTAVANALLQMSQTLQEVNEQLAASRREMAVMKAANKPTIDSPFTPKPRSLRIEKSNPSGQPVKQMSQIERLARKSVGFNE